MLFDRVFADEEASRDCLVGASSGHRSEDLALAFAESASGSRPQRGFSTSWATTDGSSPEPVGSTPPDAAVSDLDHGAPTHLLDPDIAAERLKNP
jgi:hypothetical protein